jgi:hypothetical protein
MSVQAILLPLFVHVALVFALIFWTGHLRIGALRRKETRVDDIALGQPAWPPRALQAANCFNNQFQLPVLFYVLTGFVLVLHHADLVFVVLAWVFVLSRFAHAWVFVTSNRVPARFYLYLVGAVVLLVMWVIFAVRILAGV